MTAELLPQLTVDEWEDTQHTLHLFTQIVGKVRMTLFPKTNHWWHVPLYVASHGLTTRPIPYDDKLFEIDFDFIGHTLNIQCSEGPIQQFPLEGQSVASFYRNIMAGLTTLGIDVAIKAQPYDIPFSTTPFAKDTEHASYDPQAIAKYWTLLKFVNTAFEIFRGRYVGKSTPVHLFWHHADLALTRFSGKPATPPAGGTAADQEAYSHEVISFGFWFGDSKVREPAFYAYCYPEPAGLNRETLFPATASWQNDYGYSMAFLRFEDIRTTPSPQHALLEFLEHTYRICATKAGWDLASLAAPVDTG